MGRIRQRLNHLSAIILIGFMVVPNILQAQVQGNAGVYDEGFRPQFNEKVNADDQARENTLRMKRELKLNPEQVKQVGRINLQFEKEYQDQLSNSPNMTDYDKAMLNKIRKQQLQALKEILTEDQWMVFTRKRNEPPRINEPVPSGM